MRNVGRLLLIACSMVSMGGCSTIDEGDGGGNEHLVNPQLSFLDQWKKIPWLGGIPINVEAGAEIKFTPETVEALENAGRSLEASTRNLAEASDKLDPFALKEMFRALKDSNDRVEALETFASGLQRKIDEMAGGDPVETLSYSIQGTQQNLVMIGIDEEPDIVTQFADGQPASGPLSALRLRPGQHTVRVRVTRTNGEKKPLSVSIQDSFGKVVFRFGAERAADWDKCIGDPKIVERQEGHTTHFVPFRVLIREKAPN